MQLEAGTVGKTGSVLRPFDVGLLVVDCDLRHLEYQGMSLRQQGFRVVTCGTAAAAMSVLDCERFDLVVLCQAGPRFEGRAVLEHALRANPEARVLVITNCAEVAAYLEAMNLGAVDYLENPLNSSDLAQLIGRYLPSAREKSRCSRPRRESSSIGG